MLECKVQNAPAEQADLAADGLAKAHEQVACGFGLGPGELVEKVKHALEPVQELEDVVVVQAVDRGRGPLVHRPPLNKVVHVSVEHRKPLVDRWLVPLVQWEGLDDGAVHVGSKAFVDALENVEAAEPGDRVRVHKLVVGQERLGDLCQPLEEHRGRDGQNGSADEECFN